jgi:hypothetical protein
MEDTSRGIAKANASARPTLVITVTVADGSAIYRR